MTSSRAPSVDTTVKILNPDSKQASRILPSETVSTNSKTVREDQAPKAAEEYEEALELLEQSQRIVKTHFGT